MTRPVLSTLTALVMVGTLFVGAPAPAFAADPPIIYYIAQSGTAASTPGDGTSCAAPDYVELAAGDDHASISSALTPASNGDTIYLCVGTYDIGTTIDLAGETITLQGAAAATTILDGGGTTRILTSSGAITVSDLTFQDGSTDYGGAIFALTTATVTDSTFTNNDAADDGGAIYATTVTVTDSTFTGNDADFGGAINATTVTVTDGTFTGNTAAGFGGAIYAVVTATVSASTFTGNTADFFGGAIEAATGTITRSRFTRNMAGEHGGAMFLWAPNSADLQQLRGNTFMRNTAPAGGAITLGPCTVPSRSEATRVERANRFSGNRATQQRRTNNIERWDTGGCGGG
jgi:predicted outer membrane repeat protein